MPQQLGLVIVLYTITCGHGQFCFTKVVTMYLDVHVASFYHHVRWLHCCLQGFIQDFLLGGGGGRGTM